MTRIRRFTAFGLGSEEVPGSPELSRPLEIHDMLQSPLIQFNARNGVESKLGVPNLQGLECFKPHLRRVSVDDSTSSESSDSGRLSGDKQLHPFGVGAGLDNLGNTCFMNAVLQCLTHTALLVRGFRSREHGNCQGFCVLCALREHIESSLAAPENTLAPTIFVANLKYISADFGTGLQEDAHEFLQCLLSRLAECCLDDNIVDQIFGASLKSSVRCCNCGHSSKTHERVIDLSVEIDSADTLLGALESYTKVERIEDPDQIFTCEGCEEKVSAEKQLMLEKLPSVAAIQLKRFKAKDCKVEKISKHVDFPLELDLQPYCLGCHDKNEVLKYDLYAVVVHQGFTSDSGHYYCYVRPSPDVWCKFDDWTVTTVQTSSVLLEDAYILFYARQGTPWMSELVGSRKCLDIDNLIASPHSALSSNGHTDIEFRNCRKKLEHLFSPGARYGDLEVDQTTPPEEGNSRRNGIDDRSSITNNDSSLQNESSDDSSENNYNEQRISTSLNGDDSGDLEDEDQNDIVHKTTSLTYPNENRHTLDRPAATCDTTHNSLKSEDRMKCVMSGDEILGSLEKAKRSAKKIKLTVGAVHL